MQLIYRLILTIASDPLLYGLFRSRGTATIKSSLDHRHVAAIVYGELDFNGQGQCEHRGGH